MAAPTVTQPSKWRNQPEDCHHEAESVKRALNHHLASRLVLLASLLNAMPLPHPVG